ncbi:MAG: hypothetical protein J5523_06990 [Muribaculaceae bacterium]|nr:hypothetical protein [Muribaculaceae bacterium]
MKKTILLTILLLSAFSAGATGQTGDIIYIDGEKWVLLDKPIVHDSVIHHEILAALPEDRTTSTANWDGYTAVWSIKDNKLVLDSVKYRIYHKDNGQNTSHFLSKFSLENIIKNAGYEPFVASWYNGTMRVAKGERIYYEHSGFMRNYETELHLKFEKGEVVDKTLYNNKILVDGFTITGNLIEDMKMIKELFPVNPNEYPELKGKKIGVSIKDIKVDAEGNLIDYILEVHVADKHYAKFQQLEDEINNMVKAIKPWKTLLINGEIRAEYKSIVFGLNFDER